VVNALFAIGRYFDKFFSIDAFIWLGRFVDDISKLDRTIDREVVAWNNEVGF
jgi:hypothetical protein